MDRMKEVLIMELKEKVFNSIDDALIYAKKYNESEQELLQDIALIMLDAKKEIAQIESAQIIICEEEEE